MKQYFEAYRDVSDKSFTTLKPLRVYMVTRVTFNVILKILFEAPFHISHGFSDIRSQRIRYSIKYGKKDVSLISNCFMTHAMHIRIEIETGFRTREGNTRYRIARYTTYKRGRLYADIAHPRAILSARHSISKVAILRGSLVRAMRPPGTMKSRGKIEVHGVPTRR